MDTSAQRSTSPSSGSVSASLSLHASTLSEINSKEVPPSTVEQCIKDVNNLLISEEIQTPEDCDERLKLVTDMHQLATKINNFELLNAAMAKYMMLTNLKNHFLFNEIRSLKAQLSPTFLEESESELSGSKVPLTNGNGTSKRIRNNHSPGKKSAVKKHKTIDPSLQLFNPFAPIAPEDVEPDMETDSDEDIPELPKDQSSSLTEEEFPALKKSCSNALNHPSETKQTNSQESETQHKPKAKYVPSIVIYNPTNPTQLIKILSNQSKDPIEGKMISNNRLKIFPSTSDAHRAVQRYIADHKLKSHTFEMEDERQLKVVLRGLPPDYPEKEIMQELRDYGLDPSNCHPLKNRKTKMNMPLFLVTLPKNDINKQIYQISYIDRIRVTVETLKRRTTPAQCYKCQNFFHHSKFCGRDPKCLKCAGDHLTKNCTKSEADPVKCALCEGEHTANFSGCPKNPLNKVFHNQNQNNRKVFNAAPANAWSNPIALNNIKRPENPHLTNFQQPITVQPASFHPSQQPHNSSTNLLIFNQISAMMSKFLTELATVLQNPPQNQRIQH